MLFWFCFFIIAKLLKLQKRGWEVGPGYLFAKTTKLNRFINKVAFKFPRFWRVLFTIGIGFGFFAMVFTMIWLGINLHALITDPRPENAVVPFIPGVTVTGLPLLYMILPIAIIMFAHELAHGIAARIDRVTIKSSGVLAFILLFGAFVELDDEQAAKKSRLTRQRIFVAGSFMNMIIALFSLIFVQNMYQIGPGAYLYHVLDEGPSFGKLNPSEIIISVNGTPIKNQIHLSEVLDQFKPFDPVLFTVRNLDGSLENRTVTAGFNKTATFTFWNSILIFDGSITNGTLDDLKNNDQQILTLNSSLNVLNFTLLINPSSYNLSEVNLTAIFIDLQINASLEMFETSKVFLINYSNQLSNYELLSFQNLSTEVSHTANITQAAGYTLQDYVNNSNFMAFNFFFNDTMDFNLSIDLCKVYILTDSSKSYFGIITTYNVEDRELAVIFGPLAPHIYQTFTYLYMFSLAVGLINLLPIPPFDGDHLLISLFPRQKINAKDDLLNQGEESEIKDQKDEIIKSKEPWTWTKTIIWSIRGLAIFLFVSNIVLSLILFDIFTIFRGIFY